MCSADLPLALSNERRSTLPSIATTPSQASAKQAMKSWKQWRNCSGSKAEQPAEGVVARRPALQLEEAAQKIQLGAGEFGHVGAVLPAAQHSAQSDHQYFQQIVTPALPVRGSCKPSKHALKPSIVAPCASDPQG